MKIFLFIVAFFIQNPNTARAERLSPLLHPEDLITPRSLAEIPIPFNESYQLLKAETLAAKDRLDKNEGTEGMQEIDLETIEEFPGQLWEVGINENDIVLYKHRIEIQKCRNLCLKVFELKIGITAQISDKIKAYMDVKSIYDYILSKVGVRREISWDEIKVMTENEFLEECRRKGVEIDMVNISPQPHTLCAVFYLITLPFPSFYSNVTS